MNVTKSSPSGSVSITSNGLDLYVIRIEDPIEGPDTIWLTGAQLQMLKEALNEF